MQDDAAGVAPKAPTAALAENRVGVSGIGAPGATVRVSVSGPGRTASTASTVAAVDGSWSITLDRALTVPQTATASQRLAHTAWSDSVQVRFRPMAG